MGTLIEIDDIFMNLDSLNEVISEQQLNFQLWLEREQENGVSEEEILEQINSAWAYDKKAFNSITEAEEWFDQLGI